MFVDTGAWYAAYVASDPYHARVTPLLDGASVRLVTTDFVLAETLNLLRARDEHQRAITLGQEIFSGTVADLVYVTAAELTQGFVIFSTYRDKAWSYIDCTSFVVMQRRSIRDAIALDHHFRQMPGISVFP